MNLRTLSISLYLIDFLGRKPLLPLTNLARNETSAGVQVSGWPHAGHQKDSPIRHASHQGTRTTLVFRVIVVASRAPCLSGNRVNTLWTRTALAY